MEQDGIMKAETGTKAVSLAVKILAALLIVRAVKKDYNRGMRTRHKRGHRRR